MSNPTTPSHEMEKAPLSSPTHVQGSPTHSSSGQDEKASYGEHEVADGDHKLVPATHSDIERLAQDGNTVAFADGHALVERDFDTERRVRYKTDFALIPIIWLLYLWTFIDRVNIGNARLSGLEKDLGMTGKYDYNTAISIYYVAYIIFEIPSVLLCKLIGPGWYLPTLAILFGIVAACTSKVETYGGLLAIRFFLGMLECGMLPGFAYYLSRWYRRDELVFRIAIFITASPLAGAFSGLLASAILELKSFGGVHTWRMIFAIEGIVTVCVGVLGLAFMTDSPKSARWLTPYEKAVIAFKIKSESPYSQVPVEQTRWQAVRHGILNINSLAIGFVFGITATLVQGFSVFYPTIIAGQYPHLSTNGKQLKTVPPYVAGAAWVVASSWFAWKMKNHVYVALVCGTFCVIGYAIWIAPSASLHAQYGGAFFITSGAFGFGSICNGWAAGNAAPDGSRAGAVGVVNMFGNMGGMIAAWLYLPSGAPKYHAATSWNLTVGCLATVISGGVYLYQVHENKLRAAGKRDHRLVGLNADEIALLGHRHPQYRYTY